MCFFFAILIYCKSLCFIFIFQQEEKVINAAITTVIVHVVNDIANLSFQAIHCHSDKIYGAQKFVSNIPTVSNSLKLCKDCFHLIFKSLMNSRIWLHYNLTL